MSEILREFFEALNVEEAQFGPHFAADNLGLTLRSAINELDWYYYSISNNPEPSVEEEETFYLMQLGVARLMKIALESRGAFDAPTVMFVRRPRISTPVLEMISGLGIIEHGRRVAQSIHFGMGTVERSPEGRYNFTLSAGLLDDEQYDRSIYEHYISQVRKEFFESLQSEMGREIREKVSTLLKDLVYPFADHFIGYGGDQILDEYFFGLALNEVQLYVGYDSFHYSTKFGGIPYQKFTLALVYVISLYMRHQRFSEALIEKHPEVKLENVLTISSETAGFVESLRDALDYFGSAFEGYTDTTLEDARTIFEVLSYSRKNIKMLDRPGAPLPLIIQCSDHDCIRCITAARSSSVQYLLDSLRQRFPRDYDKNQRSREQSMQRTLRRVLSNKISDLEFLENIRLRLDGRTLTDIDFVAIEKLSGAIFLCQLKHQDISGADIHSKFTRINRLKQQSSDWLDAVDQWLDVIDETTVRNTFRLPRDFPAVQIFKIIITRNGGLSIGEYKFRQKTHGFSWVQFYNAVMVMANGPDPHTLMSLAQVMVDIERISNVPEHLPEPRSLWIIRALEFAIQQAEG
jgi:hypothetical protein